MNSERLLSVHVVSCRLSLVAEMTRHIKARASSKCVSAMDTPQMTTLVASVGWYNIMIVVLLIGDSPGTLCSPTSATSPACGGRHPETLELSPDAAKSASCMTSCRMTAPRILGNSPQHFYGCCETSISSWKMSRAERCEPIAFLSLALNIMQLI